jgi:hypothetical protein
MNELMASEMLDWPVASDVPSDDAARSMIAFSLAVKNGLSLEFAEI